MPDCATNHMRPAAIFMRCGNCHNRSTTRGIHPGGSVGMRAWAGSRVADVVEAIELQALGAYDQKEGAGAADAVLMQIEWSEAEVLKSAGVGTEAEVEVVESVGMRIDGGRRRGTGRGVGIR